MPHPTEYTGNCVTIRQTDGLVSWGGKICKEKDMKVCIETTYGGGFVTCSAASFTAELIDECVGAYTVPTLNATYSY